MLAMRPDHALEQLLGARVGPALALHRSEARARSRPRPSCASRGRARRAPSGRTPRRSRSARASGRVPRTAYERQQMRVARVDHVERPGVVERRVAERGQRDHHVRAADQLVQQPGLAMSRLDPAHAGEAALELVQRHVDRDDLRARKARQPRNQVRADEAARAEHERSRGPAGKAPVAGTVRRRGTGRGMRRGTYEAPPGMKMSGQRSLPECQLRRAAFSGGVPTSHR